MRRALFQCLSLFSLVFMTQTSWAQSPAFQLDNFEPKADPTTNIINVAGSEVLPHLHVATSAAFHHSLVPLKLVSVEDGEVVVINSQSKVDLGFGIGFFESLNIEVSIPLVLFQDAGDLGILKRSASDFSGVAFGDLRVTQRVKLLDNLGGFGLALAATTFLPTGDEKTLNSGDGLRIEPVLILDYIKGDFHIAANLGYQMRNLLQLHNLVLDDQLRWGVGVELPSGWGPLQFFGTASGNVSMGDEGADPLGLEAEGLDPGDAPAEVMGGLQFDLFHELSFRLGLGTGLNNGIGAPQLRGLVDVAWTPRYETPPSPYESAFTHQHLDINRPPIDMSLTLVAPSILGRIPSRTGLRTAPGPYKVFNVDGARVIDHMAVGVEVQVGQGVPEGGGSFPKELLVDSLVTLGLFDVAALGLDVPVFFGEVGGDGTVGDIEISLKGLGVDANFTPFGVGMTVPVKIPVNRESPYSDGRIEMGSVLLFEYQFSRVDVRGNVGLKLADDFESRIPLTGLATYGMSVDSTVLNDKMRVGLEVAAEREVKGFLDPQPQSILSTSMVLGHKTAGALSYEGGVKVQNAAEDPQVEVFMSVKWRHKPKKKDSDGDSIFDEDDACIDEAEDPDGFEDGDGCPEADNDGDSVPDDIDDCPNLSGSPKVGGCPDSDGDLISQDKDKCPTVPEDNDGFEDGDGCPEPDNDGDDIEDHEDRCPNQAGIKQWQGCNDIVIQVFFETGRAKMKKVSFPTLDEMVEIIQTNKGIKRIEVQGHTDDRGSDAKNLALSERRAVAVRKYLIKAGLNPELIVASGKGESQPEVSVEGLEGAALDAARAKNRRVHFIIVP